jgi:NAD+ diphosphatase
VGFVTRFIPDAATADGPGPADRCVLVCGRRVLAPVGGELTAMADLGGRDLGAIAWVSIGALDGVRVWAGGVPQRVEALGAWRGWPAIAAEAGEPLAAITGRALQIVTWRQTHRYCGRCAAELADVPGEHARRCPSCALYVPMQLSPAVLVAVRRPAPGGGADELLLVRHTYGPTELWALVAGFVEAGESLEEAAQREVGEEVGLAIDGLAYHGSQPWAMSGPGVVLAGFHATSADPSAEPVVDGRELAEARWFPLDALPGQLPPPYSISRWLIDAAASTVQPDPARSS